MAEAFIDTLELFPRGLVYVALGIGILVIAKIAQDLASPYKIGYQLSHKDNVALALSIAGYYFGVIAVFLGALFQPFGSTVIADGNLGFTTDYWQGVLEVFIYALVGIFVLNVSRIIVDKLVLYRFSTEEEIIEQHNVGTGAVEFAVYVAIGLIIAGSIAGEGGGPENSVAFFGLGLATLIIYTLFYEMTTSFEIHDEIENNNAAVGVALAGNLIAIGIVTFKAVFGDFVNWTDSLAGFFTFAVIGFAVLLIVRLVADFVLFPGVRIANELVADQNLGVAFIEGATVISVSLILFFAI